MMKINDEFYKLLDKQVPNPKCSLDYTKDYELLIATLLSAQCTDERVNKVTPELWNKYDIYSLSCKKCPAGTYSNSNKTGCIPLPNRSLF